MTDKKVIYTVQFKDGTTDTVEGNLLTDWGRDVCIWSEGCIIWCKPRTNIHAITQTMIEDDNE